MSGHVVENWRLMAQAVAALADHLSNAIGYQCVPTTIANLPPAPTPGMIACVTDSHNNNFGQPAVTTGIGGPYTVLVWYNGTQWTVIGQ